MKNDLSTVLVTMLEELPDVVVGRKSSFTNFTVRRKVFAFTKDDGVVLKLPPETVTTLLTRKTATLLVMGKRTMKEWVVIRYKLPADAKKHLSLFKEARDYVSSTA